MENEKVTWSNFGRHPRFWRHAVVWIFFFLLISISEYYINPLYHSIYELLIRVLVNMFMYVASVYTSFYLFELFYKNQRRALFFLLHIPLFFSVALLGRIVTGMASINYGVNIWLEIINWPFTMLFIYLVRFTYHGLKTRWELNKLKSQYKKTNFALHKTQVDPQFLIQKLQNIHQYNLEDKNLANETILELADELRQRIDSTTNKEIPTRYISPTTTPIYNTQERKETAKYARLKRHLLIWSIFIFYTLANQLNSSDDWLSWLYDIPKRMVGLGIYALLIYVSIFFYKKFAPEKKYLLLLITQLAILTGFVFLIYIYRNGIGSTEIVVSLNKVVFASCFMLTGAYLIQISYDFFIEKSTLQALEVKQMEMELRLLKAQINPHFLFNILNNIYGTNLENSAKANKYIEDLINILQYQTSSQKKPFISLNEEIQIVKNYIELEKARVYNCKVHVEEKGDFSKFKIIPLLLLPLIENAFKYGTGVSSGDINIRIEQINNQFQFSCSNRIMPNKTQKTSTGIGLDNVQKRLLIRYPNKHRFIIDHTQDFFTAKINIAL